MSYQTCISFFLVFFFCYEKQQCAVELQNVCNCIIKVDCTIYTVFFKPFFLVQSGRVAKSHPKILPPKFRCVTCNDNKGIQSIQIPSIETEGVH